MTNKTAMRKLLDYLEEDDRINSNAKVYQDALEEEKKQLIDAANWDSKSISENGVAMGEKYYQSTYQNTTNQITKP